ncbi:MAG: ABC transporter permease [Ruminococcaceae bacterium]|nr:ABC transporter permease [Oscillospiraceae bacterium]
MILFLKHIRRTVKKAPVQPLLILLTLTLAISSAVTSLRMQEVFALQAEANKERFTAAGDILISPSTESTIRMLFEEDAQTIVQDRGEVIGEYALTFFKKEQNGDHLISASATDLEKADRFYDFQFTEYGEFTDHNLKNSAVISTEFSQKYGLHVGDRFSVSLFGEDLSYTVQAVAKPTGLLHSRQMLVSKDGLLQILSTHIPIIGALGDAFSPDSRLMIRAHDPADIVSLAEELKNSTAFENYYVETPYTKSSADFFVTFQTLIAAVLGAMILMLAIMLIIGSMNLLQQQRQIEYALFALAGADPGKQTLLLMLESLTYAVIGGAFGVLLAKPMLAYAGGLFSFADHSVKVGSIGSSFGILLAVLLMTVCVLWQRHKASRISVLSVLSEQTQTPADRPGARRISQLIPVVILVTLPMIALLLPVRIRFLPLFAAVFLIVILLFRFTPDLIGWVFSLMESILDSRRRPPYRLLLAGKSIRNNRLVRHVGRLFATLFAIVILVGICYTAVRGQTDLFNHTFRGEVTALNVPEKVIEQIKEEKLATGVSSLSLASSVELPNNCVAIAFAMTGDTTLCMHPELIPEQTPKGNEIVLSTGIAALTEKEVGDSIRVTLQGYAKDYTVIGINNINANFIFLDADAVSASEKIVCFKLTNTPNARQALIEKLETSGVSTLDAREIWGSVPSTLNGFLGLTFAATVISVILALLGCSTVLAQQYRARQRERELLQMSGATQSMVMSIHLTELLLVFVCALLLAVLVCLPSVFLIDQGLRSFGLILL